MTHESRVNAIVSAFEEAMARFSSRLTGAAAADAERPRADGGWSAAQIAWHVAVVNHSFASVIDGSRPVAQAPAADFIERTWDEIGGSLEKRIEAPARARPEGLVARDDAAAKLAASGELLLAALRSLDAERARMTIDSPIVGRVSLYQVGEWAVAHVVRHNKQMKQVLGEG